MKPSRTQIFVNENSEIRVTDGLMGNQVYLQSENCSIVIHSLEGLGILEDALGRSKQLLINQLFAVENAMKEATEESGGF